MSEEVNNLIRRENELLTELAKVRNVLYKIRKNCGHPNGKPMELIDRDDAYWCTDCRDMYFLE